MKVKVSWSQSHQTTSYTHNKPSSHTSCSASARRSQLPGERGTEKAAVETPPFGKRETGPLSVGPTVELLKRQRSGKHDHPHTCTHLCVITTGFQVRSKGGRWSWTLSPEEIMSREVELGCKSWTSFASGCSSTAVQRTLSLWLCPNTAVETANVRCTSRWAMARGHRLNTSIVLVAVHGLSRLFRAASAVEPSLFRPLPPIPVPNKHPCFCGCQAVWSNVIHVVHMGFPKCTNTTLNWAQDRATGV